MKQKYKEYAELIGMENLTMLSHVFGGSNKIEKSIGDGSTVG